MQAEVTAKKEMVLAVLFLLFLCFSAYAEGVDDSAMEDYYEMQIFLMASKQLQLNKEISASCRLVGADTFILLEEVSEANPRMMDQVRQKVETELLSALEMLKENRKRLWGLIISDSQENPLAVFAEVISNQEEILLYLEHVRLINEKAIAYLEAKEAVDLVADTE
ncbi:MAG: hypothetical protein UY41_C0015G0003 [Candidatus Moranbacteria bacterium GW2011_GWE1_49_15]|nr:MAG: hypothetical protein UX75_C0004G0021 [Candidatus Moranbacteria bacterium GW2011_GWE2_47_10]KKW06772.1 MAG: hypothetical protein UY41_C0015G0003 [Candidatus Moranbacteria bacterium GW2011_GWE1_49_15]